MKGEIMRTFERHLSSRRQRQEFYASPLFTDCSTLLGRFLVETATERSTRALYFSTYTFDYHPINRHVSK
jgi:hypothetical protein